MKEMSLIKTIIIDGFNGKLQKFNSQSVCLITYMSLIVKRRCYRYRIIHDSAAWVSHIHKGDTPLPLAFCVPPNFGLAYCVPPFFGLAYCVPFNNKNKNFWRFHLHKEDRMTLCLHAHVPSFFQTLALMCLSVRFPSIDLPKLMFKFIIA